MPRPPVSGQKIPANQGARSIARQRGGPLLPKVGAPADGAIHWPSGWRRVQSRSTLIIHSRRVADTRPATFEAERFNRASSGNGAAVQRRANTAPREKSVKSRGEALRDYVLRRLLLMVPTFIGITFLTFALCQFVPGGPID